MECETHRKTTQGADVSGLIGTAGNDTLGPIAGGGVMQGLEGNDWFNQDPAGADTIDGGPGSDVVFYENSPGPVTVDLTAGFASGPAIAPDALISIENVHGSQAHGDSIRGTDGNNYFFGRGGDDSIFGLDGNDNIHPGSGSDLVDGGPGFDTVSYFSDGFDIAGPGSTGAFVNLGATSLVPDSPLLGGVPVAAGTARDPWGGTDTLVGIETVTGSAFSDTIIGSSAVNRLDGGAGGDSLLGGAGNDTLLGGDGHDILRGEDGSDNLQGGAGNDTIDASGGAASSQQFGDYISPGAGHNTIIGHAELFALNEGIDIGYQGVTGTGGIVVTVGANGTGTVISNNAGVVNDTFTYAHRWDGTQAGDLFLGSANANYEGWTGSGGADTIHGGGGFDEILYHQDASWGGLGSVTVNFVSGTATDPFGATDLFTGIEAVRGTAQADQFTGSAAISYLRYRGLAGADTILGTSSFDEADYSQDANYGGSAGILADLAAGTIRDGFGTIDRVSQIDRVTGTAVADSLSGSAAHETLRGGAGDDTMRGLGGDDYLEDGAGNDLLDGGAGYDQADYRRGESGILVDMALGTVTGSATGNDTLISIERVVGSHFADTLLGSSANDDFAGERGDDYIDGRLGSDFVSMSNAAGSVVVDLAAGFATGDGNDTLISIERVSGSQFADTLLGSEDDNYFRGDGGFFGSGAADYIDGRGGIDRVDYRDDPSGVRINLSTGRAIDGRGFEDTLVSIENASGSGFADTITGSDAANLLTGRGGNDIILGGLGADTLQGEAGDDTLEGGGGNDLLQGGAGSNVARFAGNRADYELVSLGNGSYSIRDLRPSSPDGTDTISDIQRLQFADQMAVIQFSASSLSIAALNADRSEGTGGAATVFTFLVTRTGDLNAPSRVNWTTATSFIGEATADDFVGGVLPSGVIDFAMGASQAQIDVLVAADSMAERDETFLVQLNSPVFASILVGTATGVIRNDDAAVTYSIAAQIGDRAEGTGSGFSVFDYLVTRSGDLSGAGQVGWSVAGSGPNAANATDFQNGVLPSGTVSFAAGEATQTVRVRVVRDALPEADEAFTVSLLPPANGALGVSSAAGVIRNDDAAAVTYSIAAQIGDRAEGTGSGVSVFEYLVTRSGDLSGAGQVGWSVAGSGPNAANAADFQNGVLPGGTVSFAAGEATQTVRVRVVRDALPEADEAFTVSLLPPASGALGVSSAAGIIRNDDAAGATYSIAAQIGDRAEGTGSGVSVFEYLVTRSGDLSGAGQVGWSVAGSGPNAANAADFQNGVLPGGTVSFAAGEATQTVRVRVVRDALPEADEAFTVGLLPPASGALGVSSAGGVIRNDDAAVTYSIAAQIGDRAEGTGSGVSVFEYLVTRSGDLSGAGSMRFGVAGSGPNPADAADFQNGVLPGGTVSFAAGEATQTVRVRVVRDALPEADEAFTVSLSGASGGAIGTGVATGVIRNDDSSAVTYSLATSLIPGVEGTGSGVSVFQYLVTRSGDLGTATQVAWNVTGTGANPADAADFLNGVLPSGRLAFAADEVSQFLKVRVLRDAVAEADEAFQVSLASGATLSSAIVNDDGVVAFSLPPSELFLLG